jgi:hypothetical protein
MALDIIGFILLSTHIVAVGIIILWVGLGKPKTVARFRRSLRHEVLEMRQFRGCTLSLGALNDLLKSRGMHRP